MAEEKKILTPEEKKREKELLEKDKQEKAEIEKMQKEKERKRKLKEKKAKQEQKLEIKRIKGLVNLPFKLLLQVSLLASMFAIIILFFWLELDIKTTLLYLFFVFTFFYFGLGSLMVAVFYMIGEDRKREMLEEKRLEAERMQKEEQVRLDEEATKLSELERDIAEKKNDTIKAKELLPNQNETHTSNGATDVQVMQDGPLMLEESSPSLDEELMGSMNEPNYDDFMMDEMAKIAADDASDGSNQPDDSMSYFNEIMSPDFDPNKTN